MKIEKGQIKHFIAGFVIAGLIAIIVANACSLFFPAWLSGFLGSFASAGTREYADKVWGGEFDFIDLSFTAVGGAIGGLLGIVSFLI